MLRTPCRDWHAEHGARLVEFAGWEMPIQYRSVVEEHRAVRSAAGLFDIAHMGRIRFSGPDDGRFLDRLLTIEATRLPVGRVRYALVCNDAGGILDDVLVYRFDRHWLLVVNASNRGKILGWIERHRTGYDVAVEDLTRERFMFAVQGPAALSIVAPRAGCDLAALRYYRGVETTFLGEPAVVSRTGYTGEDGFEVVVPAAVGLRAWETVLAAGQGSGLVPAGLGCRDTLRLEAAMPLYGHELDEATDPYTAGLGSSVQLDRADFVGREALAALQARTDLPRRVGLELTGRRIAREGAAVSRGGRAVGRVTSGTFSPTLERTIAMAYVAPDAAAPGTDLDVDVRGTAVPAKVVPLPFYRRA
jgi:aminomethyltransferase